MLARLLVWNSSAIISKLLRWVTSSVTRLGDFRKLLATNLFTKEAQKESWLLGYFEKDQLV